MTGDAAPCPGPDDIVALMSGMLDEIAQERIEVHLDRCAACSEWVAALARSPELAPSLVRVDDGSSSEASPALAASIVEVGARLGRGQAIGRYVVEHELGSGGMGVVYAAHDPELDRRIALKLLRARTQRTDEARARLVREAQAIAQLSHRNVVTVFDVGHARLPGRDDEVVFVAMERIDGVTLRAWANQRPAPGWRALARVWLEAARGLSAAHAAGIVHRDFKPTNAMVAADGRVVVLDFGLARVAAEPESNTAEPEDERQLDRQLTHSRALLGTPAYMAPEQRRGAVADARGDQYAWCLSLVEALLGELPGTTGDALAPRLAAAGVPSRLRRLLVRGLADEPAARHPSMFAVIDALEAAIDPPRSFAALSLAGAGLVAVLATLSAIGAERVAPAPCASGAALLAGTWNAARRDALAERLGDAAWLAHVRLGVAAGLDAHAQAWIDARDAACAARAAGLEAGAFDARALCLERARLELGAVVDALGQADREGHARALLAVTALPDPHACAEPPTTSAPPSDAGSRELLEAVHVRLAQAHALERTGAIAASRALLDEALDYARRLGHGPTEAEVRTAWAVAAMAADDLDGARRELVAASWAAEAAHDHRGWARALIELVWLDGYFGLEFDRALEHAARAGELIAQLPGDRDALEAMRLRNRGWTESKRGELARAEADFRTALALWLARGDSTRDELIVRGDLATVLFQLGRIDEAEAEFERVRAVTEGWLGPEHPELAPVLNNLGAVARERGDFTGALAAFERVERIVGAAFGDDHLTVARARLNHGTALADLGRHDEARAVFERAATTLARERGPARAELARAWKGIAGAAYANGELEAARAEFERALALEQSVLGDDHPSVAVTSTNLAMVLVDLDRVAEGIVYHRRALAILRAKLGDRHPHLAVVLDGLGHAQQRLGDFAGAAQSLGEAVAISEATASPTLPVALLRLGELESARGRTDAAIAALERAVALREAAPEADPGLLAQMHFALAQALMGRDPPRARALARAVTASLPGDDPLHVEAAAWLRSQR